MQSALVLVCLVALAAAALEEKTLTSSDPKDVAPLEDQDVAEAAYRGHYGRYGGYRGGYYGRYRGRRSSDDDETAVQDQDSAEQYWGYGYPYGYYNGYRYGGYGYGGRYGGYGRGYWSRGRRSVDEDQQTDEQYYGRYHGYGRRGYYGGYRRYYY